MDETYCLNNSGNGPLQVLGIGGIPLHYELALERRFAHAIVEWRQDPTITEHELCMVRAMNMITDVNNWPVHVFNGSITATWRDVTRAHYPIITDSAWDWCLQELRDKATEFSHKGFVQVLDTGSLVCKSDSLLSSQQLSNFKSSVNHLFMKARVSDETGEVDIVDPQMYPLVFQQTPVLCEGGKTSRSDVFSTAQAMPVSVEMDQQDESEAKSIRLARQNSSADTFCKCEGQVQRDSKL